MNSYLALERRSKREESEFNTAEQHITTRQLISSTQALKILLHPIYYIDIFILKKKGEKINTKHNKPQKLSKSIVFHELLTMSAISTLKVLEQTCTCSLLCTCHKFHFTRWAKLSSMLKCKHEVKVLLTLLGLLYSSTSTTQLSGPLVFRLLI